MKILIKLIITSFLLTSLTSLKAEEPAGQKSDLDILSRLEQIPPHLEESIVKAITQGEIKNTLRTGQAPNLSLAQVGWTDEDSKKLEEALLAQKGKVASLVFLTQMKLVKDEDSVANLIFQEMKKIKPELKDLSRYSEQNINNKVIPKLNNQISKAIFTKTEASLESGGLFTGNSSGGVFNVKGRFCFNPVKINAMILKDGCITAKVGTVTGIKIFEGKIKISNNKTLKKLEDLGIVFTASALNLNHNFKNGLTTLELVRPGLQMNPTKNTYIRLELPVGFDNEGLKLDLQAVAGFKKENIFGTQLDFGSEVMASTSQCGGRLSLSHPLDQNQEFNLGIMLNALHNYNSNSRRGYETNGNDLYGPGFYGGLNFTYTPRR